MGKKKNGKPPVHPGKILLEGYMKERNIGIGEMGEALGISRNQISGIVNGRKCITPQTAIKLADVTGSPAQLYGSTFKTDTTSGIKTKP